MEVLLVLVAVIALVVLVKAKDAGHIDSITGTLWEMTKALFEGMANLVRAIFRR